MYKELSTAEITERQLSAFIPS